MNRTWYPPLEVQSASYRMKALAQHRGLFAVLLALIALGFMSFIALAARGGSPPRIVDWALLLWVGFLAGVTYALGRVSDRNANG